MDMTYSYICPHCKESQNSIKSVEHGAIYYKYHFKTKRWDMKPEIGETDLIGYLCAGCGNDLEGKLAEEIRNKINE